MEGLALLYFRFLYFQHMIEDMNFHIPDSGALINVPHNYELLVWKHKQK